MSVQKFRELGQEEYRIWRAAEIESRRIRRQPMVIERVVEKIVEVPVLADPPTAAHVPPAELADLIYVHETAEQTNLRLTGLYVEAMNKAEIARTHGGVFEGKSVTDWLRKAERYESGIKWNRGRMAESV